MQEEIVKMLFNLQDKKYQEFHSKLCPNTENIIGVRIPDLRKMAKKITKQNGKEFLQNINCKYYETIMLYGMVIGYMNIDLKERQKYLDIFVPNIDNWAVCDCCISTYKFTNKTKKEMWEYIQKYINSEKEFEIRFAVVMMMYYYLDDEYIDKVLSIINELNTNKYYDKMGVAWLISLAFVKYENKIKQFLKESKLDDFTYNKSIQKIIESNRVTKQTKNEISKMKRK